MFAEELLKTQKALSAQDSQAYVVIATDTPLPEGKTETFTFQQVDVPSLTLLPTYVKVSFTSRGDAGDNFQRPLTMAETSMRFAGRKFAPGDYALVYVSDQSSGVSFHCYSEGAPIYRFQEGTINIVRQGDVSAAAASVCRTAVTAYGRDSEVLQAQVAGLMAGYPEMTAPLVFARPLGTARCDPGKSWPVGSPCTANDSFSFATLSLP
jgi:hypothetical protein